MRHAGWIGRAPLGSGTVIGPGDEEAAARLRADVAGARDPGELGRALSALARHERGRGRAMEAAELAGRAAAAHHRAGAVLATARAQRLAADCLADADRHEDALGLLKRARRAFVDDDPKGADVAGVEAAAARSLRALGLLEESRAALHRAERTFLAASMPVRAAVCRLDRAVLLHDEGDPADAAELLIEARATFLAHRRPDLAAVSDFDLGVALLDDGRADDAIERFVQARGIFASLDRRADEAACDLNMGVALHAVGRSDEARHALRRVAGHVPRPRPRPRRGAGRARPRRARRPGRARHRGAVGPARPRGDPRRGRGRADPGRHDL